jgi:hypothetical protein
MRNAVTVLTIVLLAASPAAIAAGPWALELQSGSPLALSGAKVWIGLRNTGADAQAVCVHSASVKIATTGASVVPAVTHSCTTEPEVHLVLPGEAYWVLGNFPRSDMQTELTVSVDVVSWRPTEAVTTAPRPTIVVSRQWSSLANAFRANDRVTP